MKNTFFSLLLLSMAVVGASAQTLVKGDMNGDGQVTISDVTSVVNVILGKSPVETINVGGSPYQVDNSYVVGTWYAPDGTHFTFNTDGTTDFPGGASYRFYPGQNRLLILNASGRAVQVIPLVEATSSYLLAVDYATGSLTYYTNSASLVTSISLSQTSLTMNSNETVQLTATVSPSETGVPYLSWSSSDESVATVDQDGLVYAMYVGTSTITCTAIDGSGVSARCEVIVSHDDMSGTIGGHDYIDLVLPSGTLWASCNIGAINPEDYGDYFAWGETVSYNGEDYSNAMNYAYNDSSSYIKTYYDWRTYKYCNGKEKTLTKYCQNSSYGYNGFTDTLKELETTDDAAYSKWGATWCMPSKEQYDELINDNYTILERISQNGVYGIKITSRSNGNSIFLPAAGSGYLSSFNGVGTIVDYWSRTISNNGTNAYGSIDSNACELHTNNYTYKVDNYSRCLALPIRPVRATQQ